MARPSSRLQDWIFSAPIKRELVAFVVDPRHQGSDLTQRQFARRIKAGPRASLSGHLDALAQLGQVRRIEAEAPRWIVLPIAELGETARRIRLALGELVSALDQVPDEPLRRG